MKGYKLISIDLQHDFTEENGRHYKPRPSVTFDKDQLIPFLKERHLFLDEIISDYRQPRPGDRGKGCTPGTWGYESIIPKELVKSQWIKCMNSPLWVRDNIGDGEKEAGVPRQDPDGFSRWLNDNIGEPSEVIPVLFGLTIDCCVLSTAQELTWRGYEPLVLKEAVDHYTGKEEDKEAVLCSPVSNWADVITWDELRVKLL